MSAVAEALAQDIVGTTESADDDIEPASPTTPGAPERAPQPPGPSAERPQPAVSAEALRALLRLMLQLACSGVTWTDPALGTPVGEHLTAEAIAVLQVGR